MYPELFRIGNFPVNTYGVFLAIAFLCAIYVTVKLAQRDGLPRERIYDLSLWMLLASLIGSKVLMLFTEPEYRDKLHGRFFCRWISCAPEACFMVDCSAPSSLVIS